MDLVSLVRGYEADPLRVEGGGTLRAVLRPGAGEATIAAWQAGIPLPVVGTYLEFLRLSDGMSLYGVEILGTRPPPETDLENLGEMLRRRLVPFHDWGNGDFDCVDLTKVIEGEPAVVFWNDEDQTLFPITGGFAKWLPMAVYEVSRFGRLLHPRDYAEARYADAQGVYESIANVKKTFYGGAGEEALSRVEPPPPPGRRARLKQWIRGRLGRG